MNTYSQLTLLLIGAILAGCNSAPKRDADFAATVAPAQPPKPMGNGAIFQAGYEQRWFEDIRARRVGDILTINLVEETDASSSAAGSVDKSSSWSVTEPTIFSEQLNVAIPGITGTSPAGLGFDVNTESSFAGSGDNTQSNALNGSLTVTVTEVLPNGYLKVRGEKRIGMNGGNEYVKIAGIVRPADIDTSNTIDSTKIADATLIYVGDGQRAEATVMGWLAKFFISSLMPF